MFKSSNIKAAGSDSVNHFYRLKLSKAQFDSLKSYFPDTSSYNHLVFQFFYPEIPTGGSPTLFAYTMTHGGIPTGNPPVILDYDSVTTEPLSGRAQVLGDLHIRIDSMVNLISQTGSDTGSYKYFLFTPVFHPDNPHEAYDVSLVGLARTYSGSKHTDPSPPAPAP